MLQRSSTMVASLVLTACLLAVGCDPNVDCANLGGTATVNGNGVGDLPVRVEFTSSTLEPARTETDASGEYSFEFCEEEETGAVRVVLERVPEGATCSPTETNTDLIRGRDTTVDFSCTTGVQGPELCTGGEDEDADGLIDCSDLQDCACADECIEEFIESCSPTNLLADGGFETTEPSFPFPDDVGLWGGDVSQVVEEGDIGFLPVEGDRAMQYLSTFDSPTPTDSSSADVVQLVDTADLRGRRVCGYAQFARVAGDEDTDTQFSVVTAWYAGGSTDFAGFPADTEDADADRLTPGITSTCFATGRCGNGQRQVEAAATWIEAWSTTVVPDDIETTALVMVRAAENVENDGGDDDTQADDPEFDGHFVDDVRLYVVPDVCN
ncbi:MAG: hypothetical protein AAF997_19415 [Myxococcota bacterium]